MNIIYGLYFMGVLCLCSASALASTYAYKREDAGDGQQHVKTNANHQPYYSRQRGEQPTITQRFTYRSKFSTASADLDWSKVRKKNDERKNASDQKPSTLSPNNSDTPASVYSGWQPSSLLEQNDSTRKPLDTHSFNTIADPNDLEGQCQSLISQSQILADSGKNEEALEGFERAAPLIRDHPKLEAQRLLGQGKALGALHRDEGALKCFERAAPLTRGHTKWEAQRLLG